ncbi:MAG TPA: DUF2306 domain-containing protein [Gammaproteobacteria bacterium]|nr:DUF2306 domain-containing protein [Gammaproteobacteria bacterium]
MLTVSRRILIAIGAVSSAAVAIVSYRYLWPSLPVSGLVATNAFGVPWLTVHAAAAATALLVGPLQFRSQLRARRPKLHRVLGRVYVTGCVVGGATGLLLALGTTAGPVATAGFGSLAVVWLVATARAWRLAVRRVLAQHREWMVRSFALTFAAVTLRIYLPISQTLPVELDDAYRAISFLCWVPNLLVAELYLRTRRGRGSSVDQRVASPIKMTPTKIINQ